MLLEMMLYVECRMELHGSFSLRRPFYSETKHLRSLFPYEEGKRRLDTRWGLKLNKGPGQSTYMPSRSAKEVRRSKAGCSFLA
jgi:hypothetical protein